MARIGAFGSNLSDLFYTRSSSVGNTQDQTVVLWHATGRTEMMAQFGTRGLFSVSNNTGGDSLGVYWNSNSLRFIFNASTSSGVWDASNPLSSNYPVHAYAHERFSCSIATYDYTGKDIESAECGLDRLGRRLIRYRQDSNTNAVGTVRSKQRIYVNSREGLNESADRVGGVALLNIKASSHLRSALIQDPWSPMLIQRSLRPFFAPLDSTTRVQEFGDESMNNPTIGGTHNVFTPNPLRCIAYSKAGRFGRNSAGAGAQTITPASIAAATALGVITLGSIYTITPTSIAAVASFGATTLGSEYTITPASVAAAVSFGTTTLVPGAVTITPASVAAAASFGMTTLDGIYTITPASVTATASFGATILEPGAATITPASIASTTALGTPTLLGEYTITPASIAAAASFGTATLDTILTILAAAIGATTTFGTITLVPGAVTITPSGIDPTATFGTTIVSIPSGTYALVIVAPDESAPGVPITIMTELAQGDAQTPFDAAPTIRIFTLDPTTGARTTAVNASMTAAGTAYKYAWTPSASGVYAVYVSGTASGTDYGDSVNTTIRPKFDPIALALHDTLVARN